MGDTINTFGFNATLYTNRVTVHGGNHFPRLAVFAERQAKKNMVNTVLRSSLSMWTPRHRAPPQLSQVQVIRWDVACHVMRNVSSTICAYACLHVAKPTLAFQPNQLQSRRGPLSPQVTHFRRRDCRTVHIGHIYKRHVMEPPCLCSGVRYKHSDTVLGPTGQHPSRFGVLV